MDGEHPRVAHFGILKDLTLKGDVSLVITNAQLKKRNIIG